MEFYTAHEVAEILRLSYPTVYKLIKNGDIEAVKLGAHYRVPKSAIENMINKNKDKNKDEKVQE